MKRTLLQAAALLVCALALTACAAESEPLTSPPPTAGTATAQPSASAQPSPSDMATQTAGQTESPMAMGVQDADMARRAAEELKNELEQLSEVTDAKVVIAGQQAAVGLTFDAQYQAGVTDRMRDMVKERLDGVVTGVTRLAVTDDPAQLETIGQLSEQLQNATDLTDIENKLSALINKMEAGGESLQTTETGSAS